MQARLRCIEDPSKVLEIPDFNGQADVILGIPCFTRPVHWSWIKSIASLKCPLSQAILAEQGNNPVIDGIKGDFNLIAKARDRIVLRAIQARAKYLLFVDDDVELPSDALLSLLEVLKDYSQVKVCGGVYPRKGDDFYPVLWTVEGEDVESWNPADAPFECGAVGAGCMLIDMSIFSVIPAPRFQPITQPNDDVLFCTRVRKAGFRVFAHGGVRCGHWAGFRKYILNGSQ